MVDGVFDASSGRGQLMERMTFVQSGELSLDAIYLRGKRRPAAVIVPAIHEPGGSMEGPIANELAYAIGYAGHASLRFAWPGQGASDGQPARSAVARSCGSTSRGPSGRPRPTRRPRRRPGSARRSGP